MKVEIEIPDDAIVVAIRTAGERALGLNWNNQCTGQVARTIETIAADKMNAAIAVMDIEAKKAAAAAVKEITR